MENRSRLHNRVVAAFLALVFCAGLGATGAQAADEAKLDDLFTRLARASDAAEAGRIEAEIMIEWSKSGSPAMDLLMQRGNDAMQAGLYAIAVEHFTAVIDHDPDYAEARNARAEAYYASGEIGPALADMAQVLTADPRHFDTLSGLGVILEETGEEEKALQAYLAAAAIHPYIQPVNDAIARLETKLQGQEL